MALYPERLDRFARHIVIPELGGAGQVALVNAQDHWRRAIQPLVDAALTDGTVADGVDPEAVVFFIRTMHLGLLLQRGAGIEPPDEAGWGDLVNRIVASFGDGKKKKK